MAIGASKSSVKKKQKMHNFAWEGVDKSRRPTSGLIAAPSEEAAIRIIQLESGAKVQKIRKKRNVGKAIKPKDVCVFTRQLATMMRAGVPLLQSFDIVAKGSNNPRLTQLLFNIKGDIEGGSTMADAFAKHPKHFNDLYCNLLRAGESAGILETILDRLAVYQEKMIAIRSKIKSALMYPTVIISAAVGITTLIMILVIPAFKSVFQSFGAELPGPTQLVMDISEFMVGNGVILLIFTVGFFVGLHQLHMKSEGFRNLCDRAILKLPIFGSIIEKSVIARWNRTLSTMFSAGVPMTECLDCVAGASGNYVYRVATEKIKSQVATGTSLTMAMNNSNRFPVMVNQFASIGEETGSIDSMLSKAADFYEQEVDDAVATLSSLMEPIIILILGGLVGGIVIAMYMPLFKLGGAM